MDTLSTRPTGLSPRAQRWSWALVLACGLMLAYFVLQTYASPKQRQYQLDFGNAQWIESPEVEPVAYFRTEVFLSSAPEQAWMEIAATENYNLIVHSHTIADDSD